MTKKSPPQTSVIYQAKDGAIELRSDIKADTIWATQAQIVKLFAVDQSVVSRHIKNIFKDGEVLEKSNMQKMHNANSDKPVLLYSLDVILAVGYRTNSKVAIDFRKWATKTLKSYISQGFVVNKKQISKNYSQFLEAIKNIKTLLPSDQKIDNRDVLNLISAFAETWLSLDAYDKDQLANIGKTKKLVSLTAKELEGAITELKKELFKKGEATAIFAKEREVENVTGIFGNIMQSFGGAALYPTLEEKAAHLLYFMVKNHPFVDGNKRCGAFAFVWFLKKCNLLDQTKISPQALTALTLLIAESDPKQKDKMVKLVLQMLRK